MKLSNKTWASFMIKHSRCKQIEAQCIFNRPFFKRWREAIAAYTNACLFSLALIFKTIFLKNHTEGRNMFNSCIFNSIVSGKEKPFWYLNEFMKQGKVVYNHFQKKGASLLQVSNLDFALHVKHILSHLLSLLWVVSWQIDQVLLAAAMHLKQTRSHL